jgi:hypothetical protein
MLSIPALADQAPAVTELPVDITGPALVKKVRAAIGDEASWAAAAMVTSKGIVEVSGQTLKIEMAEGLGDLAIGTFTAEGKLVSATGCDDAVSWEQDDEGVTVHEGDELKEGLDDCRYLSEQDLTGYKEVKVTGKARQGENEFYMVDAYGPTGLHTVLTIDAKTFLPQAVISQRHIEGQLVTQTMVMSDYRRAGGLLMPHLVQGKVGTLRMAIRLESVVVSTTLDKARFVRPKS